MSTRKRGVKRSGADISNAISPLSSNSEHSFKPEQFTDFTVHYLSHSYHMHKYVGVTMSKYFQVALESAPDSCSVCESRGDSHRCITLEGSEIGGVVVSARQLLGFFEHVYAMLGPSGEFKALIEKKRIPSYPSRWPANYLMGQVLEVTPADDSAKLRIYDLDCTYDMSMKGASFTQGGKSVKLSTSSVGLWFHSLSTSVHPNYHLANYFQVDCLVKEFEKQAGIIVKLAADSKIQRCVWRILELADRYHWKDVRAVCIPLCAKDSQIRDQASWKVVARRVCTETMIELFESR